MALHVPRPPGISQMLKDGARVKFCVIEIEICVAIQSSAKLHSAIHCNCVTSWCNRSDW